MTLPSGPTDPLVGQILPGGLEVLERVGGIGEGAVYRARYSRTGPPVALTILALPANPRASFAAASPSARPWQVLRRACEIRHPNVARLYEVGETREGMVYAASELLAGDLLSELLAVFGTLPEAQAVDVCLQAAAGLQAAHGVGVTHGAVSPAAILITPREDEGMLVKLIRFDSSRHEEAFGRGHVRSAEEPYSSPERLAGKTPDELDDVFSLGAVLHHLLAGAPPGGARVPGSAPRTLRRVVHRALAPRGERYPSVAAFADALARAAKVRGAHMGGGHRRRVWLATTSILALVAAGLWVGRVGVRASAHSTPDPEELATLPGDSAKDPHPPSTPRGTSAARPVPRQGPGVVGSRPNRAPPAPRPPVPAMPSQAVPGDSSRQPSDTGAAAGAKALPAGNRDSNADAVLSPFRQSHPWAAHPDGRVYFRSSCSVALAASDLIYFATEAEARATGRTPSAVPGCS